MRLEKTNNVYILGAGCSRATGAPLMADFIDKAYELRRYSKAQIDRQSFDSVFDGINALQAVYAKSVLDLRNLESVFAAFEMAELFGRLGELEAAQVAALPVALRILILETLEWTVRFPTAQPGGNYHASGRDYGSAGDYRAFAEHIQQIRDRHSCTVMTFNYDIALDLALKLFGANPNYCLSGMADIGNQQVPLLKLHGSLNWARCKECGDIQAIDVDSGKVEYPSGEIRHLRFGEKCKELVHCGLPRQIAIVPPTWSKAQHHKQFADLWHTAAVKLAEADNIFIIGYSLPPTDQFFRYLFALGTMGKSRLQRVWIFNPDEQCDKNFRDLLGPMAMERYEFKAITFDRATQLINKELA